MTVTATYGSATQAATLAVAPVAGGGDARLGEPDPSSVVGGSELDGDGNALLSGARGRGGGGAREQPRPWPPFRASVTVLGWREDTPTFTVATSAVTPRAHAEISASDGGATQAATLTVAPPAPVVADARLGDLEPHQRRRRQRGRPAR